MKVRINPYFDTCKANYSSVGPHSISASQPSDSWPSVDVDATGEVTIFSIDNRFHIADEHHSFIYREPDQ